MSSPKPPIALSAGNYANIVVALNSNPAVQDTLLEIPSPTVSSPPATADCSPSSWKLELMQCER